MIWLMFDCPSTGAPLRTRMTFEDVAAAPTTTVSLHCPRCAQLHRFRRDEATLELSGERARPPAVLA